MNVNNNDSVGGSPVIILTEDNNVSTQTSADDEDDSDVQHSTEKFPYEPVKTFLAFVMLLISLIITAFALVIAHENMPEGDPLPDIILDNVIDLDWGLDACEYIMFVEMLGVAVLLFFHKYRLIVLRRLFFIASILYLYRALSFFVTSVPKADPSYHCEPKYNGTIPFVEILKRSAVVVSGVGISLTEHMIYCGDYIYSGHTIVFVCSFLIFCEYTPRGCFILQWASFLASVMGIVFLLLGRGHYTVDIVLAYILTTQLWCIYHTLASVDFSANKCGNGFRNIWWWRIFSYFEKNVPGRIPHKFCLPFPKAWRQRMRMKFSQIFQKE